MNSEELELSLRTEFESYLKGFLADMRQEVSEFRKNFEAEFEKHRSQTDEAVRRLVEKFEKSVEFDRAFNESVVEHLRLARDEGATITAVAIGEAEKLKEQSAPAAADYDKLRDAINEISSKTSQSEILTSLVDHASNFAPRGVFFIVKNDHFVGWRAFGDETAADETAVRAIQFPLNSDTVLADAVSALATTAAGAAAHAENGLFLDALDFGTPDRMYAIPLVARGRGVAVLYADFGTDGVKLQPEALETLVRVAGLTVELAAAGVQPVPAAPPVEKTAPVESIPTVEAAQDTETSDQEQAGSFEEYPGIPEEVQPDAEELQAPAEAFAGHASASFQEQTADFEVVTEQESAPVQDYQPVAVETCERDQTAQPAEEVDEQPQVERFENPAEEVTYFEPVEEQVVTEPEAAETGSSFDFSVPATAAEEFPDVIEESVGQPAAEYVLQAEPAMEGSNGVPAPAVSEVTSAQAERTRYRDRNVDLPIAVPEEERRLHNDARRFARLLVSEIRLYNEQKVSEGREAGDLYDRLREAIDRSREMYDKRVQQQVSDKFDYFHYELVNSLAEGSDVKLGASYPGSKVPA